MKVVGVHDSSLEKLHLSEMSLEKPLQLQIRFLPMHVDEQTTEPIQHSFTLSAIDG